jgi:hypothetical protein
MQDFGVLNAGVDPSGQPIQYGDSCTKKRQTPETRCLRYVSAICVFLPVSVLVSGS